MTGIHRNLSNLHERRTRAQTLISRLLLHQSSSLESMHFHRHLSTKSSLAKKNPIVIVGGGPSGLLMSNLLSLYAVPSVLLERQSVESRFRHPQAHFLNTRTMEILKFWLPNVYNKVQQAMPPFEHWKYFRFGRSMSDDQPLAHVVHPVDQPLQAQRDANGVLVEDVVETDTRRDLSACTVGQLAQHTFCQILHDAAMEQKESELHYGTNVTQVHRDKHGKLQVHTEDGASYMADICIAADGVHSTLRRSLHIEWRGQEGLQHLMNIHVKLSPQQAARLHHNDNHAMLYSIFSEKVVAMAVCHSIGEYIIQIPYFPPYQHPDIDFGPDRLPIILQAIFGDAVNDWEVVSVKPWTMSSLIADRYYDESGIVLVGDAAHVFPPAGGLGMNTGLQDVHNLAWKLAWVFHNDRIKEIPNILQSYQDERRPIAQQNAALSVRNYQRLLQVTKSCYLNDQHPALLQKMLDNSPLPLSAKQTIFQSLLRTALYPLSWLAQPQSMYANHIRNNIRHTLKRGAGLPLLFPKHELGFGYNASHSDDKNDWRQDTAWEPTIAVGKLLPHVQVQVVSNNTIMYPNLQHLSHDDETFSLSGLPQYVARDHQPTFVVLLIGNVNQDFIQEIPNLVGLPMELVQLVVDNKPLSTAKTKDCLVLCESSGNQAAFSVPEPCLVLIRPDGHVAQIVTEHFRKDSETVRRRNALMPNVMHSQ